MYFLVANLQQIVNLIFQTNVDIQNKFIIKFMIKKH
jgi:hypothetical protein